MFVLLGAIMVLAMHAGFAFLELGTVRKKKQVNALIKSWSIFRCRRSHIFFIDLQHRVWHQFLRRCGGPRSQKRHDLVKFFFLLTFAAAVPSIVSGAIAERARFNPQLAATFALLGFVYPFFEGIAWNGNYGIQDWLLASYGAKFHDFAGSGGGARGGGWIALAAVILLGPRHHSEQMENRRHAGAVAATWVVRCLGRHCRRHLWHEGAGRPGRRK